MKLFGHPGSICTNRVLLTFAERAHEVELLRVDLARGEHKAPAYVARQPFGVIPLLEDGSFTLYESRAIMRYLDDALPGPKLTPSEPQLRALMEQWISIETSYLSPPVSEIVHQKFLQPMRGGTVDLGALERARQAIAGVFEVMESALSRSTHLAADSFTLADVSTMPLLGMLVVADEAELLAARPRLSAWWQRVSARPSWQHLPR
jgi:glutathione S-transferase